MFLRRLLLTVSSTALTTQVERVEARRKLTAYFIFFLSFSELFHTERSHVRNLKVLDIVFMKPLASKQCLKPEELSLVFPNLNELLDIHVKFNNSMKNKRKENPIVKDVGDILVNMVKQDDVACNVHS